MTELDFRKEVGSRISYYRRIKGLTQSALGEKINYTDKAVSKWERGESLPDAFVLLKISDIFGVTLNELTGQNQQKINEGDAVLAELSKQKLFKHRMVTALSAGLVWLVASVVFFLSDLILNSILKMNCSYLALSFVYAIPVTFIVTLIFACIWGRIWHQAASVSGILWGGVAALLISFYIFDFALKSGFYILIAAAFFQLLVILWYTMKRKLQKKNSPE